MEVYDADTARAWLQSWGTSMREGILLESIRGTKLCISVCGPRAPKVKRGYEDALAVLEAALVELRQKKEPDES